MKIFPSQLTALLPAAPNRRNVALLMRFLGFLAGLVAVYSILFHIIMEAEGRDHSWLTGLYWTLTVMSTLGFGDITFQSDVGRVFSIIVLLSGMVLLLILLPFTFIEFFYAPWMQAQNEARAPRRLPPETEGHVLLTSYDAVSALLIQRLEQRGYQYALLVGNLPEALRLYDLGIRVVFGAIDRPETYRAVRAGKAALVAATGGDMVNTNIAFTVREISAEVPIVTTADMADSVEILTLAGSSHVLRLPELMGEANARRISGVDARAHIVGQFGELLIAESTATGTPLVGRTLAEIRLRELAGVSVVGLWKRGRFEPATGQSQVDAHTVLLLAGSREQLTRYDELFCIYNVSSGAVIIIGGGRVGRATARALEKREVDYRIIERDPTRIRDPEKYILGSAADAATLERAGIGSAPAVVVTAHDDDISIYLTIYCRRLQPDIQIISRATAERNISTLYRAGADFVLSYASMGAESILELLHGSSGMMLTEGLHISETEVPPTLAGKTLGEADIAHTTGCNVVALRTKEGFSLNPSAATPIPAGARLIFAATVDAEKRFLEAYGAGVSRRTAIPGMRHSEAWRAPGTPPAH